MDSELNNDFDYLVGAFEEFMVLAEGQVLNQPVMQFGCLGIVLMKQLREVRDRVFELNRASNPSSPTPDAVG